MGVERRLPRETEWSVRQCSRAGPTPSPAPSASAAFRLEGGALRSLQARAGNRAVARMVAVQRFELREYTDVLPPSPYTTIHFRFDHEAENGYPHQHLHITVQNDNRPDEPKVRYYYNSWTDTWRTVGRNVLRGDVNKAKREAIEWATRHAATYRTPFRPPAAPAGRQTFDLDADFPPGLNTMTKAEIEKAARAKARADEQAALAATKREERQRKRELERVAKVRRVEEAEKRRAREATIANLALAIHIAFEIGMAKATERATSVIDGTAENETPRTEMSEAALDMYG